MKYQPDSLLTITVTAQPAATDATLSAGPYTIPAKLGRAGLVPEGAEKKEGDGATPQGRFALRQVYYRPDRMPRPRTDLTVMPLKPDDLWCDDPAHVLYNRPVSTPFAASHEDMWREDRCYDIVIVLDQNLTRPVPGAGSAIFFHLTTNDHQPGPTEGCVAIAPTDMMRLLPHLSRGVVMEIRSA
ncbi:L,D-transpeptidase [Parvularcula sp. LCG005]|uniref:L,D-transpeptidase family protein n=1 Tax=Parvularcula sp. LCG005 TaxID=3078805 RepID=UPI002942402E|nr:L,D-transpeptidase family protein [Parvularcula sp. LCG005]WOI53218.1 L,D-transpeptidase family protein [Parvularcula sp. LCG005]